jgi:hypothetical protein
MANGLDQLSRRAFLIERTQDLGLAGLLITAGPVFGRMLSSIYDQDRAGDHRGLVHAPHSGPSARDLRSDGTE